MLRGLIPAVMQIFVELPDGKNITLEVESSEFISTVKEKIPGKDLFPIMQLQILLWANDMQKHYIEPSTCAGVNLSFVKNLYLDGQMLSDMHTVENYRIKDNDTLCLDINLSWSMSSSTEQTNEKEPEGQEGM